MAQWSHRYDLTGIPPSGSQGGIITEHKPGQKLAKAVTEIQERVVIDVETELDGIQDQGTAIENNKLVLRLKGAGEGVTQNLNVVVGGEWPELLTQGIEVEDGLIKSVTDGQLGYPEKDLYTGNIVVGATLGYAGDTLTLTLTKQAVDSGLVVDGTTTEELTVTIEIPDSIPAGGEQYQVLQRDESGAAVWDYVRAVEIV